MTPATVDIFYILAAALFIVGIKMLGSAATARKGNLLSALGMLVAIVVTLTTAGLDLKWIGAGVALGSLIGTFAAKRVQMTAMPELVALFNGFGGLASLLVAWSEWGKILASGALSSGQAGAPPLPFTLGVIATAALIGGVTFTGSVQAWGKLSGVFGSRARLLPGQRFFSAGVSMVIVLCCVAFAAGPAASISTPHAVLLFYSIVGLSLIAGVLLVIPIGGGDMPVVIALLNSLSGLAAAAAGFVILNTVLIVAGCLVGCSGLILTVIMCKAMNRQLTHVLFSGFGAASDASIAPTEGEMKAASIEDAYYVLEAASSVVIIPGYGMAVAQAQHAVKELAEILEANGTEVRFAIHPVAGRMPGHMNVLLAEADVPYEQLCEMDDINALMPSVDVAIVIGANDVVNPAAADDPASPIYGMPIINAHLAGTVFALKRGQGAGFSGLVNKLYFLDKTRMLYGDAKATVSALVSQLKDR